MIKKSIFCLINVFFFSIFCHAQISSEAHIILNNGTEISGTIKSFDATKGITIVVAGFETQLKMSDVAKIVTSNEKEHPATEQSKERNNDTVTTPITLIPTNDTNTLEESNYPKAVPLIEKGEKGQRGSLRELRNTNTIMTILNTSNTVFEGRSKTEFQKYLASQNSKRKGNQNFDDVWNEAEKDFLFSFVKCCNKKQDDVEFVVDNSTAKFILFVTPIDIEECGNNDIEYIITDKDLKELWRVRLEADGGFFDDGLKLINEGFQNAGKKFGKFFCDELDEY